MQPNQKSTKDPLTYIATTPCLKGFQLLVTTWDDQRQPSTTVVEDDEGQPRFFEYIVQARDWAVAELGVDPSPSTSEEAWAEAREQIIADRRRQKHEDLPLFGHGKEKQDE
jgi:hypothetical protein